MNFFQHKQLLRLSMILLTLILSGMCIITSAFWPERTTQTASSSVKISSVQEPIPPQNHMLMVKEHNGKLCVYSDGILTLQTDVPIASLPEQDRIALSKGIVIENEAALQHLLEDFGA